MRLGALGILLLVATYVVVGAHPAWDGVYNGEQPSPGVRMKKCMACQTIGLPNARHNPHGGGGAGGTMTHPTRQGFFAFVLRNLMPRDRYGPVTSPGVKIHLRLEEKEDQPKFTEEKINNPFVGLKVNDADKIIVGAQTVLPSIEKKDCRILKCLSLYLALHRLQRNSSKLIPNSLIGTISRTKDKGFQNIDYIMKQIKIYCKYPQTAIKDRIHKLIGARIHFKNVSEVVPELGRHEDVNLTSLHENSLHSNAKQEMDIYGLKPIDATQPEINDKIHMKKITSTHVNIPSIPATKTPQISENLLLGSTETTGNWKYNDTVNDELDSVTSSSSTDEPYLQLTTDGNNDFQTSHTDFFDVNAYLKLGTVTQGFSSTTVETYIQPTIDGHKDFNTTFTELKPTNVTSGRLLKIFPGRILFLYKGQTVPMLFVRTENGTTVIAIDGDYVCNRTINNPLRYETKFSKLCYNI